MQLNEGLEKLGGEVTGEEEASAGLVFAFSSIESIKLPSTLKRIEAGTFKACERLKNVEIPNGMEHIGKACFNWCSLESIVLPASVEEIGEKAFYDNKLREVVFASGSGVRVVGDYAFGLNDQLDQEKVSFRSEERR